MSVADFQAQIEVDLVVPFPSFLAMLGISKYNFSTQSSMKRKIKSYST